MPRCSYRHGAFAKSNAFRGDGSDQCWVDDVGNFGTLNLPDFRCLFHAPAKHLPIDRDDWPVDKRGELQSESLKALLDHWYNETPIGALAFCMPGLHCGPIDLTDRIFAADFSCPEASFNGDAKFNQTFFSRSVVFDSVRFSGGAGFNEAVFRGDVKFNDVTFQGEAGFIGTTFNKSNGYTEFCRAVFCSDAWFRKAIFLHGSGRFKLATFHGEANFDDSRFEHNAWFTGVRFEKFANFYSTHFANQAGFNHAYFKGHADFDSAIFKDIAYFEYATFEAHVELCSAEFRLGLKLWHCHYEYPTQITKCGICMLLYGVHTGERVSFSQCYMLERDEIHATRAFTEDFIDGVWNFANQSCCSLSFLNMDLSGVQFLGANVREAIFDSCTWLSDSKYAKVYSHDEIISKNDSAGLEQLRSLYQQLKKNLDGDHN